VDPVDDPRVSLDYSLRLLLHSQIWLATMTVSCISIILLVLVKIKKNRNLWLLNPFESVIALVILVILECVLMLVC